LRIASRLKLDDNTLRHIRDIDLAFPSQANCDGARVVPGASEPCGGKTEADDFKFYFSYRDEM
jgi:hypothetical protein